MQLPVPMQLPQASNLIAYFNNCRNRKHADLFGPNAFFDLDADRSNYGDANGMLAGQLCFVASYTEDNQVQIDHHELASERTLIDDGVRVQVFFGPSLGQSILQKADAYADMLYRPFFNKDGAFRRPSFRLVNLREGVESCAALQGAATASTPLPLLEGALKQSVSKRYERNAKARTDCISHHGTQCYCCTMDFGQFYGPDVEGFIHVHHRNPIHLNDGKAVVVDPVKDLVPVCPNCHAFIHHGGHNRTPESVRRIVAERGG